MSDYEKNVRTGERKTSKIREHIGRGMTAFLVIVCAVLFYFAILRLDDIINGIKKIMDLLAPVITGFVIAFLLNPLVKLFEKWFRPLFTKWIKNEDKAHGVTKTTSVVCALVSGLLIIVALLNMVIPELVKSVTDLALKLPGMVNQMIKEVNDFIKDDTTTGKILHDVLIAVSEWVKEQVSSMEFLKHSDAVINGVTTGVKSVIDGVKNFVIGLIVSVYLLFGKDKFIKQGKKLLYAFFDAKKANFILHIGEKANDIFSGFLIGKIIDSAIIGLLCFIGMTILRLPYALLVSVIVGVTNVIPVFGPYIGAIPSALLIILVDPMKGLYFIIFVFLLQQLDGNVIGPKILGESTGLTAFWVIFSILIFGGFFGIGGMIIGVPTFALIYYMVEMYVEEKLTQRKLPTDTDSYELGYYVNEVGELTAPEVSEKPENKTSEKEKKRAEKQKRKKEKKEKQEKQEKKAEVEHNADSSAE